MQCIFCRGAEAIHLDKDFPLCDICLTLRDLMQDYHETQNEHGLSLEEYGRSLMKAFEEMPSATVH